MIARLGTAMGSIRSVVHWALVATALCAPSTTAADRPRQQNIKAPVFPGSLASGAAIRPAQLTPSSQDRPSAKLANAVHSTPEIATPAADSQSMSEFAVTPSQILDGRDIACRTVQNWGPAHVLRARAQTLIQMYSEEDECTRQAAHALAAFLHMQANHQEDIGAASALRAYYTRIAILEHLSLSQEALLMVGQEEAKQEAMQDRGMPAGTDLSEFQRRRIEIQDKQLQLLSQDRQLRCLLSQLAKVNYAMDDVLQEPLDVYESALDCEQLRQFALRTRHDLRGWSYLAGQVNDTSAPVFAKMLTTLIGGWALPLPTIGGIKDLFCPPDYSSLTSNMRYELRLTVETHCKWISQAVEEKCAKLRLTYQRIALAQQMVASWEARMAQLERLEEMGQAQAEQSAMARVGWLESRGEEASRRLDARIAEIDLAESIGGLAKRCCDKLPWLLTGYE